VLFANELAVSDASPSTPSVGSSPAADVFAFLLELGKALLATGDAVSDIELRLVQAAKAYGQPDARVMVLPTVVAIAGGPRQPATLATVNTDGSLGSAGPQLRLDQITEVLHVARAAAAGEMPVDRGLAALERVHEMPSRYNPLVTILGYVVVTLGIGLILEPSVPLLPAYGALGLLVALLRDGATRVPGLATILPVLAAGTVSAIAFAMSGRYEAAPLAELIAPLVLFLPGALLTMATVDLASVEVVTGASRFLAGLLQLALLAFGIVAGAMLVGVTATRSPSAPTDVLGSWAPWVGVLVFALGTTLQHSAPRRSLPWLLLVLYAAWGGQLLGQVLFGAGLSGFVGGLVVAPLAMFIERFPSAPPALVSFLPAFWLLVPGALGLIGFTQLVGNEPIAGVTSFVAALVSIISIALGILIGIRALRIVQGAVASARHMARSA
jgi:uncharacterized membrane protein YjjP (DUF1212 family)